MIEWFHNYMFYQIALNEVLKHVEFEEMLFLVLPSNENYFNIADINSIQIIETRKQIIKFLRKYGINTDNISLDQSCIEFKDDQINFPFDTFFSNLNKTINHIKRETLRIYTTLLLANFYQFHIGNELVKKINLYADSDIYNFTCYVKSIAYDKNQISTLNDSHIIRPLNILWQKGMTSSCIVKVKHFYFTPDLFILGNRIVFAEVEYENDGKLVYHNKIGHSIDIGNIMESHSGENVNIEFQPAIICKNDYRPFITTLKYEHGNMDKFLTELNFYLSSDKFNYNINYLCSFTTNNYQITPEWYNDKRLVFCSDD